MFQLSILSDFYRCLNFRILLNLFKNLFLCFSFKTNNCLNFSKQTGARLEATPCKANMSLDDHALLEYRFKVTYAPSPLSSLDNYYLVFTV